MKNADQKYYLNFNSLKTQGFPKRIPWSITLKQAKERRIYIRFWVFAMPYKSALRCFLKYRTRNEKKQEKRSLIWYHDLC